MSFLTVVAFYVRDVYVVSTQVSLELYVFSRGGRVAYKVNGESVWDRGL